MLTKKTTDVDMPRKGHWDHGLGQYCLNNKVANTDLLVVLFQLHAYSNEKHSSFAIGPTLSLHFNIIAVLRPLKS